MATGVPVLDKKRIPPCNIPSALRDDDDDDDSGDGDDACGSGGDGIGVVVARFDNDDMIDLSTFVVCSVVLSAVTLVGVVLIAGLVVVVFGLLLRTLLSSSRWIGTTALLVLILFVVDAPAGVV